MLSHADLIGLGTITVMALGLLAQGLIFLRVRAHEKGRTEAEARSRDSVLGGELKTLAGVVAELKKDLRAELKEGLALIAEVVTRTAVLAERVEGHEAMLARDDDRFNEINRAIYALARGDHLTPFAPGERERPVRRARRAAP